MHRGLRAPSCRRLCRRGSPVGVAPKAHRFTDEESAYREFLVRNNWCRVLPIAALKPETFAAAVAEIEPIKENPLDALAARLKERLPALF